MSNTSAHSYDPANMNVFSGANSLIDYFNPDKNAPLPLVELPPQLNPYYDDGVRIYAKMLTALPATNVKSLPGKFKRSSPQMMPRGSTWRNERRTSFREAGRSRVHFHLCFRREAARGWMRLGGKEARRGCSFMCAMHEDPLQDPR